MIFCYFVSVTYYQKDYHIVLLSSGTDILIPFFPLFSALEDFNNGVVLTNRPLRVNELFEVRLDKMVSKWAGSIEIGVTTYSPSELEYPATMTNIRLVRPVLQNASCNFLCNGPIPSVVVH